MSAWRGDDLTRAFEFERRWFERCSTRLERFEFGVAYLDEDYPQRYFSNFLLADSTLSGASVEALIEAAERILGDAGCESCADFERPARPMVADIAVSR